jgi:NAD(P)-dependent dehydrogenase (short-subunit alcohol dehydrogenase family)
MESGQVAVVVTGGASGIGRACAQALAGNQRHVCVCDLNMDAAQNVAASLAGASAWHLDVAEPVEVTEVFGQIAHSVGRIGVLVTSAGIPGHGQVSELTDDAWRRVMSVDLDGVFYCMREALKQMLPERDGIIVNISSMCGIMGCTSSPAYSAAKAGVIGLSKSVARRHTEDGIRVNVVAPGVVDTPLVDVDRRMGKLEKGIAKIPMGRMGTAWEIGQLVAFLCADSGAFLAGQVISPNGGQLI